MFEVNQKVWVYDHRMKPVVCVVTESMPEIYACVVVVENNPDHFYNEEAIFDEHIYAYPEDRNRLIEQIQSDATFLMMYAEDLQNA
jgi:hypothetical protein